MSKGGWLRLANTKIKSTQAVFFGQHVSSLVWRQGMCEHLSVPMSREMLRQQLHKIHKRLTQHCIFPLRQASHFDSLCLHEMRQQRRLQVHSLHVLLSADTFSPEWSCCRFFPSFRNMLAAVSSNASSHLNNKSSLSVSILEKKTYILSLFLKQYDHHSETG